MALGRYELVPISLREAKEFTDAHHRHNKGAKGHKFSIGLQKGGQLVGVATVGRPIARHQDDGLTAEVTRVCVFGDDVRDANSMLYGAACRACKAMGYKSVITYTLKTESGSSLKAAGFQCDGDVRIKKDGWNVPGRAREVQEISLTPKQRWRRIL